MTVQYGSNDRPFWLKTVRSRATVHFHPLGPSTLYLTPVCDYSGPEMVRRSSKKTVNKDTQMKSKDVVTMLNAFLMLNEDIGSVNAWIFLTKNF